MFGFINLIFFTDNIFKSDYYATNNIILLKHKEKIEEKCWEKNKVIYCAK